MNKRPVIVRRGSRYCGSRCPEACVVCLFASSFIGFGFAIVYWLYIRCLAHGNPYFRLKHTTENPGSNAHEYSGIVRDIENGSYALRWAQPSSKRARL